MLSVYKMNCLSVPISLLSYMIQNTVVVTCVTNTRHQKWKDNVKKKLLFIYRYDSCIDNKEAALWLFYGSLPYTGIIIKILWHAVL